MTLDEILLGGGLGAAAVLSLLEIAPIKVNPWRAIARGIGRALNGDVLDRLAQVQKAQQDTSSALEAHIKDYDEYKADEHRAAILAFNTSLLRGEKHTQEDFFDAFRHIDLYEDYCRSHPGYKNNRAVHAIANIGRVYDERLKARDFLGGVTREE